MTTQMNTTYINALLADASYVQLTDANGVILGDILANLTARLTQPLANLITTNFEVLNQEVVSSNGFSATASVGRMSVALSAE